MNYLHPSHPGLPAFRPLSDKQLQQDSPYGYNPSSGLACVPTASVSVSLTSGDNHFFASISSFSIFQVLFGTSFMGHCGLDPPPEPCEHLCSTPSSHQMLAISSR